MESVARGHGMAIRAGSGIFSRREPCNSDGFMHRAGGVTAIVVARVRDDGALVLQSLCAPLTARDQGRFASPLNARRKVRFYIRKGGGVQHLLRQCVDLAVGRPFAAAVDVAPVQIYAA